MTGLCVFLSVLWESWQTATWMIHQSGTRVTVLQTCFTALRMHGYKGYNGTTHTSNPVEMNSWHTLVTYSNETHEASQKEMTTSLVRFQDKSMPICDFKCTVSVFSSTVNPLQTFSKYKGRHKTTDYSQTLRQVWLNDMKGYYSQLGVGMMWRLMHFFD